MSKQTIAAIKRHRAGKMARLVARAYRLNKKGKRDEMYHEIVEEFIELGGVYVKFLQGVLLQSATMKKYRSPKRLRVFENLDHEPIDMQQFLQKELTQEQLGKIATVQPQPFAAGSFGQVYFGQLTDGTSVVLKVLRPQVRELLPFDLKVITTFARRFYSKQLANMNMSLDQALGEFKNATLRETDYRHEAEFADELYQVYKNHEYIVIPKTYLELCTDDLIVQEYVDGLSAAYLVSLKEQGVDVSSYVAEKIGSNLDSQLSILGYEALSAVFNLPRIPGDPHPGNIRFLPGNKIGLIDFGISANAPADKAAFLSMLEGMQKLYAGKQTVGSLFEAFIKFFVSDLYKALKKIASIAGKTGEEANITEHIGDLAEKAFDNTMGAKVDLMAMIKDGSIFKVINKIVNRGNRFGLVMKIEASEILRASQTYITLVDALGRTDSVMPEMFNAVIARVQVEHPELIADQGDQMSIGRAIEIVSGWLERVAERDPALFAELANKIKLGNTKLGTESSNV